MKQATFFPKYLALSEYKNYGLVTASKDIPVAVKIFQPFHLRQELNQIYPENLVLSSSRLS